MKWADPTGLNDTFSISLGFAIESKLLFQLALKVFQRIIEQGTHMLRRLTGAHLDWTC